MSIRRRGRALVPLVLLAACSRQPAPVHLVPVPVEALVDETTIRARCVDPEGVIARRALCVLKDLPGGTTPAPPASR